MRQAQVNKFITNVYTYFKTAINLAVFYKMMTEMIAIRLEKKLNDQLEERLKIEKTTRSNYIRAAIMEKLNKNKEATQLKKKSSCSEICWNFTASGRW
jgi:hypothetical protein